MGILHSVYPFTSGWTSELFLLLITMASVCVDADFNSREYISISRTVTAQLYHNHFLTDICSLICEAEKQTEMDS